jgi:hypothetical protein
MQGRSSFWKLSKKVETIGVIGKVFFVGRKSSTRHDDARNEQEKRLTEGPLGAFRERKARKSLVREFPLPFAQTIDKIDVKMPF